MTIHREYLAERHGSRDTKVSQIWNGAGHVETTYIPEKAAQKVNHRTSGASPYDTTTVVDSDTYACLR